MAGVDQDGVQGGVLGDKAREAVASDNGSLEASKDMALTPSGMAAVAGLEQKTAPL